MIKRIKRHIFPLLYKAAKVYWFFARPKTKGVKCAVLCEGNILLVKLSYAHDKWTIPGGGIKRNESHENAAIREVSEEVGVTLTEVQVIGQYDTVIDFKNDTVFCFQGNTNVKEITIDNAEIVDAQWFSLEDLPEYRTKQTSLIIDMIQV